MTAEPLVGRRLPRLESHSKVTGGVREGDKVVTAGAFILKSELFGEQM